ncbi:type III polyketide synthase [Streptomyces californicus]
MATLCRPAIAVPEHVITMQQTLDLARETHAGHPQRDLVLRLIRNTGVQTRHLVQPIEETLRHPGFEVRNRVYEAEAKARVPDVVRRALAHAETEAAEIDLIVYVSCTGFMMPARRRMGHRPRRPARAAAGRQLHHHGHRQGREGVRRRHRDRHRAHRVRRPGREGVRRGRRRP